MFIVQAISVEGCIQFSYAQSCPDQNSNTINVVHLPSAYLSYLGNIDEPSYDVLTLLY